jgi:hypothetical protein
VSGAENPKVGKRARVLIQSGGLTLDSIGLERLTRVQRREHRVQGVNLCMQ